VIAPLVPCPSCARHVRATESACPFCATARVPSAAPVTRTPGQRLSRAALFALGASAAAVAACSGSVTPLYGAPASDSGALDGTSDAKPDEDVQNLPPYGIPPMDAGNDGPVPVPAYGAPPPDGG
jgi:hypothetical protein